MTTWPRRPGALDSRPGEPERQLSFEARVPATAPGAPAAGPAPEGAPSPPASPPVPALPAATATARIWGVSDLVRAARLSLESRFADVRVEGEISGLKRSGAGHLYFCLKDESAQMDCTMFAREAGRLKFKPEDGLQVRCRGRLTIYEGRGKFQLSVAALEPTGAGALALAFEQLKKRLAGEGLFDPARKRPLPFLPRRIGIVTSVSGAVIRDVIKVTHRRFPVPILLAPTIVQGPGAELAIAAALRALGRVRDVDVIILARGGGSLEDLWAFNEEAVARAIAASPVPVISAVGHETDFTIADFVADVRAPTPSAAAETAVPVADDLRAEVGVLNRRVARATRGRLDAAALTLERARSRLGDPRRLIDPRRQAVDELAGRAGRAMIGQIGRRRAAQRALELGLARCHPSRRLADRRAALLALRRSLEQAIELCTRRRRVGIDAVAGKLEALSPLRVLERGYSLTRGPGGRLVTRADAVTAGDTVKITLRQGELDARVEGSSGDPGRSPRR